MITYSFPGKVVLVTGSSRGIGAAVLSAFARAGATCVLHYWPTRTGPTRRTPTPWPPTCAPSRAPPTVHLLAADVRDAAQVETLFKQVKDVCGGLDVLVNNAGVIRDRTLKKMTLDEWHAVLRTNLDGVFHCCKFGTEVMRDGGRVVNVASVAGLVGFHGQSNYAAAKAGVIGLTRVLAKELARRRSPPTRSPPGSFRRPCWARSSRT